MKTFIHDDFLLTTEFARRLYHQYAKSQPIIDYHCHLSPENIASDRRFNNLTEVWLEGDHYKWRAMRTLGVAEQYITGQAAPEEKFGKWAYTVPYTMRNPLYHWTHLELLRYFGVQELLSPANATAVYQQANDILQGPDHTTRGLLKQMKVEVVGTTDDPIDTLEHHRHIRLTYPELIVAPTFRPDKSYAIDQPEQYVRYIQQLGAVSDVNIATWNDLLTALSRRVQFFHEHGCRLSDHGLEYIAMPVDGAAAPDKTFARLMKHEPVSAADNQTFRYSLLLELSKMYHSKGWTQQFHLGALRNTNARMLRELGPDTGFDSIGDFAQARSLANFLNALDSTNQLAQTILYNLNPADNEVMGTMIGNFNDGSVKGKIQFGSAWWFLDQKDGMEKQINALSNLGLLSCFVGMLTDSRSFLSYPRHEYFRRLLCQIIARDVANGELPADENWLGKLVSDICYHNAKAYFKFSNTPQPA